MSVKLTASDCVKLKLTIDEKQNQRSIHADFSQTSAAGKISAASHIIESALVTTIANSYDMSGLLSQPVLDLVRLSLPPQSIVSKANPLGTYNLLLQKTVTEQVSFLLNSLTKKNKNVPNGFQLNPEFQLDLLIDDKNYLIKADSKKIIFKDLDYLIQSHKLSPIVAQQIDGNLKLTLKVETSENIFIKPRMVLNTYSQDFMMISGVALSKDSTTPLKKNDIIELNWTLVK